MVDLKVRAPDFYDNLLDGYYYKEIVRTILDISGYMVFPYGYESAFSYIKIQLHKGEIKNTLAAKKIRSSPDLLVYDENRKEIELLEVKSRNWDDEKSVEVGKLDWYKKYWDGSILAVIVPHAHWFYAQQVDKLEVRSDKTYNLAEEFEEFEGIFTRVCTDTLYRFKANIAEKMKRTGPFYFPESDESLFSQSIVQLVEDNSGKTKEQLFEILNRDNLVSMRVFTDLLEKLAQEGKIRATKNKFYQK
jgi:hypothetical protein